MRSSMLPIPAPISKAFSGEILLDGRLLDGGSYSLLSHSGSLAVSVPEGSNATIATAVGSGDVRASFPLPASERPGRRRQTFRLGNGSALVELEAFSGSILLLRPAEMAERLDRLGRMRDDEDRKAKARAKPKPEENLDRDADHDRYATDHQGS